MKTVKKGMILIFIYGLLSGCTGTGNRQREVIRKVKVEKVNQADSLLKISYPGIIREANHLDLAFRVAGPILRVHVKEGDYVKEGQLVAQIDPRDYEIQLQATQAQYEQVKAEADRVIELYERKSVAVNDYDKAVSGEKMAVAQLKNAKDQLNDTRLQAPLSGYIQKINYLQGEMVDAGMPVASLIDVGQYHVEVEIPVSLYVKKDRIISFSGIQPVVSDTEFPLELLSYSKKANNNQLYKLQLRLNPASQPELAPGMDIQVNIVLKGERGSLLCVPLNALFYKDGKTYVWIYRSDTKTVNSREVRTGKLTGDGRVNINEGLKLNEDIVVAGVNLLIENQKVEPIEPVSETNIGGLL